MGSMVIVIQATASDQEGGKIGQGQAHSGRPPSLLQILFDSVTAGLKEEAKSGDWRRCWRDTHAVLFFNEKIRLLLA